MLNYNSLAEGLGEPLELLQFFVITAIATK